MSRIKLRELLNFTEQAPQPPPAPGQPPIPAPAPSATPAPGVSPTPDAPAPEGDETPTPDDPGEYDFTRDFKTFESTVEKAKQAAKKKFLDKLNQFVKDKKVTVNASRGYGQPQKDYTIDSVTKASVDWYYNKNVVVLTDSNGKEYFLTPGVNVKIEAAAPAEPEAPAEQPQDNAPAEPPKQAPGQQPPPGGQQPGGQPGAQATGQPGQPPEGQPGAEPAAEEPAPEDPQAALKKKKKMPAPPMEEEAVDATEDRPMAAEDVKDVGNLFYDFIPDNVKDSIGRRFDIRKYFKRGTSSAQSGDTGWGAEYTIEIPADIFGGQLDEKEFKLEVTNQMRTYGGPGQPFSRGSVDIRKHGRYYVFDFHESGGLDI